MSTDLYAGLDLGQSQDHSALAVSEKVDVPAGTDLVKRYTEGGLSYAEEERTTERKYALRHAERWDLGTEYPDIVGDIVTIMARLEELGEAELVVDATGVGRPVLDMMNRAGLNPTPVWITGGDNVNQNEGEYRVPKRDLATNLQSLVQSDRLRFAPDIEVLEALKKEMQNFSAKINRESGHVSYEHLRQSEKDDLVLALAIAMWYAEYRGRKPRSVPGAKIQL